MGPSYANLFVSYIEHLIFKQYTGPKPEYFGRYIDDCIGATSCSRADLDIFISYVNSFHPALEFTWEISDKSVTFLDISVSVTDDRLSTSVHYKPTDSHSYLLYSSSHPKHTLNAIPFSQFLRLRRLCSDDEDFSNKCSEMRSFFLNRNYPAHVIDNAFRKVSTIDRATALNHLLKSLIILIVPLLMLFIASNVLAAIFFILVKLAAVSVIVSVIIFTMFATTILPNQFPATSIYLTTPFLISLFLVYLWLVAITIAAKPKRCGTFIDWALIIPMV